MAYVTPNFKTKKQLKEAVAAGQYVEAFQPGGLFPLGMGTREISVEGPHYPQPHTWYARVEVQDGRVTRVIS